MEIITILLIAFGLSFDSFAVSVSSGIAKTKIIFWDAGKIALSLAIFQGLMPLLGWLIGVQVKDYISNYDHWLAFGLLSILGLKMIYEGISKKEENEKNNPLNFWYLMGISLATSIDAFVVGITMGFIDIHIILSVIIIGSITFIVSMLGILFGKKVGNQFGKKMEILGGVILFGIGLKILLSHLNWI